MYRLLMNCNYRKCIVSKTMIIPLKMINISSEAFKSFQRSFSEEESFYSKYYRTECFCVLKFVNTLTGPVLYYQQ